METTLDQNPVQFNDVEALKKKNKAITDSLRQQRRINRANIADAKVTNIVSGAADKQGIDVNTPYSYPVTDDFGKNLVDTLANHVSEEDKPKLSTFISSIPSPNYIAPPTINIDEEKAKAKLQRKVRWADALYAFGEGMQGKTANKDVMGSTKLQRERDTKFQNFKLISEANKKTANDWEVNSRKEALDWIDKKLASGALTAEQERKYNLAKDQLLQQQTQFDTEMGFKKDELTSRENRDMAELKSREGLTQAQIDAENKRSDAQLKNQKDINAMDNASRERLVKSQNKTLYSDTYYKLSGNSPKALIAFAKYSGAPQDENGNIQLTDSDIERYSASMLGQMYNIDKDGNMTPKPGKENFIADVTNKIATIDQIPEQIKQLQDEMAMKKKDNHFWQSDSKIDDEYLPKIQALQSQLQAGQTELNNMFSGAKPSGPVNNSPEQAIDDFFK
jgi:hypothetical protein